MKYNLAYLSYNNSDQDLMNRSVEILDDFFKAGHYCIKPNEGQLLFVASGGSEQNAIELTRYSENIIVLCHRENNSYAAAMEIAAYLRLKNKRVSIIDVMAPNAFSEFENVQILNQALGNLAKQKAALIGEVSDWLIVSDVDAELIKKKLGVELMHLSWSQLDDYRQKEASADFLKHFPKYNSDKLKDTAKVYALLEQVIQENELTGISVECFSMVVRDKVTACLPLAVLNKKNIVAACEGDICSMLGKLMIRAISGEIPWQANVAEIKDDTVLLAHCTAPLNVLKSFEITTHFETNVGTAIKGVFKKQEVGVFRVNSTLDRYMLLQGEIVDTPSHNFACRTQIEFKTSKKQTELLKNQSLGNHHLVFPIGYAALLERMMQVLGIEKVNARH